MAELKEPRLLYNCILTPDGTALVSRHRHDYVSYVDDNKETYVNDGGLDYLRRSVNKEPYIDMSIYDTDDFETIRFYFERCGYGKNGDEPLHYTKLKDMSDDHIQAVIDYETERGGKFIEIYKKEQKYRKKKGL